ncbi:MAG: hypothetical protein EBQ82_07830 [Betaproteobacteria bacterium]|nr:hypothetical protein [Betaproteobacteria bacterium]NBY05281.1 hypothetical protein [Betaproteobacteria bacterium]
MTTFVHIDYAKTHPGVERALRVAGKFKGFTARLSQERGLAALLRWSVAAALLVAALQAIDSLSENHWMLAWLAMWLVALSALGFFARPMPHKPWAERLAAWNLRRKQAEADRRLWALAQVDPRIMAELQAAVTRAKG